MAVVTWAGTSVVRSFYPGVLLSSFFFFFFFDPEFPPPPLREFLLSFLVKIRKVSEFGLSEARVGGSRPPFDGSSAAKRDFLTHVRGN